MPELDSLVVCFSAVDSSASALLILHFQSRIKYAYATLSLAAQLCTRRVRDNNCNCTGEMGQLGSWPNRASSLSRPTQRVAGDYFIFSYIAIALVPGSSYYSCWPTKSSRPDAADAAADDAVSFCFGAWHKTTATTVEPRLE